MFKEIIIQTLLSAILIYASIKDIRTHEVPDLVAVLITLLGFVGKSSAQCVTHALAAVVFTLPMLIAVMCSPGKIGGADIKITAACIFLLGIRSGVLFVILELLLAVITESILRRVQGSSYEEPFALVPYLGIACIFAYCI